MATAPSKKPCAICGLNRLVYHCAGCDTSFCLKHLSLHREELGNQLDQIQEESKLLQQIYNQQEEWHAHPLFCQIDAWKEDMITKIVQTAERAHEELRRVLEESNKRMKKTFQEFDEQFKTGRQAEEFNEIELEQWKEQLKNIKIQIETPSDIELIPDKSVPPIELIKINLVKESLLFSQTIQASADSSNIKFSCEDETQSSVGEATIECSSSNEENLELMTTACSSSIDSIEDNHLILLQLSSDDYQSPLLPILHQLTDDKLEILPTEEACFNRLQFIQQATIFIDLSNQSLNEQECVLDKISQSMNVYSIYIRGNPPEEDNKRANFFRQYSKIKAIFESEQRLMVQWAIDTANELRKTGDQYVEQGDKEKGRRSFEQGITLYKRLSSYLNEKRRVR